MTQIAGEVLLQTVKLSLRRRALQKSAGGGNGALAQARCAPPTRACRYDIGTGEVVYRFVHIHSKILKKATAPGQPRGLCGCLWCLMSLQQVNACIRIGF